MHAQLRAGVLAVTLVALVIVAGLRAAGQTEPRVALQPGQPVTARIDATAVHRYAVDVPAGSLLTVDVVQTGIDTRIRVVAPEPDPAVEFDDTVRQASELVRVVTTTSGRHLVEVTAVPEPEAERSGGDYSIALRALRPATLEEIAHLRDYDAARARHKHALRRLQPLLLARTVPRKEAEAIGRDFEALAAFWSANGNRYHAVEALTYQARVLKTVVEDLPAAKQTLEQALGLTAPLTTALQRSLVLNDLAVIDQLLGNPGPALSRLEEALTLMAQAGHPVNHAIQTSNLGLTYARSGQYERAIERNLRAAETFRRNNLPDREALTLSDLAGMWEDLGDMAAALDVQRRAVETAEAANSDLAVAVAVGNLGRRLQRAGRLDEARAPLERALALATAIGNTRVQSSAASGLARLDVEVGRPEAALTTSARALALAESIGNPVSEAAAWHTRGQALMALGRRQESALALEEARIRYARANMAGELADVLRLQARGLAEDGDLPAARTRLEEAIAVGDTARVRLLAPDLRATHAATRDRTFADYVNVRLQLHAVELDGGHAAAAVEAVELVRARSLLDLLAEARADVRTGGDSALIARDREVRDAIDAKSQALAAATGGGRTSPLATRLAAEVQDLTAELRVVERRLRESSPRYAALTMPQPLSAADIQARVVDDDTVLLEFVLGESKSWVIGVTPAAIATAELPPGVLIESAARRAAEMLAAPATTAARRRAQTTALQALSDMVLGPIASHLQGQWHGKRLAVVAFGALEYVPLASLPLPRLSSGDVPAVAVGLVHEVVNVPSASVLDDLRRHAATRPAARRAVAVVADPVFSRDDPRVPLRRGVRPEADRRLPARAAFGRLPFTRDEAAAIRALAPAGQVFTATGFDATSDLVTSGQLAGFRVVHLATHGVLNAERPDLSGLAFSSVGKDGRQRDGFLRADAIYNAKIDADLVVLSACQTALGRAIRGEGLTGMTRAWMYAGAPRVVASLWRVDDAASAALMRHFYRGLLREGLSPSAALRAAQSAVARTPGWHDPYYWAGFVLQGDWR